MSLRKRMAVVLCLVVFLVSITTNIYARSVVRAGNCIPDGYVITDTYFEPSISQFSDIQYFVIDKLGDKNYINKFYALQDVPKGWKVTSTYSEWINFHKVQFCSIKKINY